MSRLEAEIESLHAEADRLRAREARVQALVEAAEAHQCCGTRWEDMCPKCRAVRVALDALDAADKEGA